MNRFDALVFICSVLSFNDKDNSALRDRITSEKVDWPLVVKIASDHLVTPALGVRLERKGLLEALPDEELAGYFHTIRDLNAKRNESLRAQAADVCRVINSAGIEPLMLKGAGNMLSGLYDDPAIRFMGDLDILVRPEWMQPCLEALHTAGYSELGRPRPGMHHHQPLAHDDYPAPVELHTAVMPAPAGWVLSAEDMFADSAIMEENGARILIPSAHTRMIHNIAHAGIVHGGFDLQYIQQMYDMVMLEKTFGQSLDWQEIKKPFDKQGEWFRAQIYLERAGRLFGSPDPDRVGAAPSKLKAPLTWALFKGQVNNRGIRGTSFIVDNYIKVIYRIYTSGSARKHLLGNLRTPRFYSRHVGRMMRAFRNRTP